MSRMTWIVTALVLTYSVHRIVSRVLAPALDQPGRLSLQQELVCPGNGPEGTSQSRFSNSELTDKKNMRNQLPRKATDGD